jgi:uncharacterized protein YjbI with pentapeptide repeats
LNQTKLQDASFVECKILGMDFTETNDFIIKIDFDKSKVIDCIFSELNLKNTNFTNSEILNCDFFQTNLSKSDFSNSSLMGSVFEGTNLSNATFTDATEYQINPSKNKLKGATFSLPEAISLLNNFEIKINL